MPRNLDPLQLRPDEIRYLNAYINRGKRSARAIKRAYVSRHLHPGRSTKQQVNWQVSGFGLVT